jgi:hypothetical protein
MVGKEMWIENSANSWHSVFTIPSAPERAHLSNYLRLGYRTLDHISALA